MHKNHVGVNKEKQIHLEVLKALQCQKIEIDIE